MCLGNMRRQEEIFKYRVLLWYFLVFIFINFRHVKSSINKQLLAKFQGEQLLICHVPCIAQINIHLSLIPVFNVHRNMVKSNVWWINKCKNIRIFCIWSSAPLFLPKNLVLIFFDILSHLSKETILKRLRHVKPLCASKN